MHDLSILSVSGSGSASASKSRVRTGINMITINNINNNNHKTMGGGGACQSTFFLPSLLSFCISCYLYFLTAAPPLLRFFLTFHHWGWKCFHFLLQLLVHKVTGIVSQYCYCYCSCCHRSTVQILLLLLFMLSQVQCPNTVTASLHAVTGPVSHYCRC